MKTALTRTHLVTIIIFLRLERSGSSRFSFGCVDVMFYFIELEFSIRHLLLFFCLKPSSSWQRVRWNIPPLVFSAWMANPILIRREFSCTYLNGNDFACTRSSSGPSLPPFAALTLPISLSTRMSFSSCSTGIFLVSCVARSMIRQTSSGSGLDLLQESFCWFHD